MKMTSRTRSTSISGVTFMSALGVQFLGLEDILCTKVLFASAMLNGHYSPPACPALALFSTMRPMSSAPAFAQQVHRVHDRAVVEILIRLDDDDLSTSSSNESVTFAVSSAGRTCTEFT